MMKKLIVVTLMAVLIGAFRPIEKAGAGTTIDYRRYMAPTVKAEIQRNLENLTYELTEYDEPIMEFFVNDHPVERSNVPPGKDFRNL